ncbi:hypothetical protein Naga_100368g2 [Nannochloropsis gaditana]|uniref:Uncharacterized protein n=1 Tax=Nannochloropsis gaditana TaxID=72520 RepID=W7TMM6_9STRA|nr:hypothetical protein Naga_100368g2 [Nannochloropsis gaditana]
MRLSLTSTCHRRPFSLPTSHQKSSSINRLIPRYIRRPPSKPFRKLAASLSFVPQQLFVVAAITHPP